MAQRQYGHAPISRVHLGSGLRDKRARFFPSEPTAAAKAWQCASAPSRPPKFAPSPGPTEVMKKLMSWDAAGRAKRERTADAMRVFRMGYLAKCSKMVRCHRGTEPNLTVPIMFDCSDRSQRAIACAAKAAPPSPCCRRMRDSRKSLSPGLSASRRTMPDPSSSPLGWKT